jgi:hypothetical protein
MYSRLAHSPSRRSRDILRLRMENPIKTATRQPHSCKNVEGEFDRFTSFMKRLVAVRHAEIKAKLDADKHAKMRKSKRTSASRV